MAAEPSENNAPNSAGFDSAGFDSAGFDSAGFDSAGFDSARLGDADNSAASDDAQTGSGNWDALFVAGISHEMRSSLQAIAGLSELLQSSADLSPGDRRNVEVINEETHVLKNMVDELLDYAKIEAGQMELAMDPFSPAQVVESAARAQQPLADEKGLVLSISVGPDVPPAVRGDEHRLRQILVNLVSNAVKYTTAGSVTVNVNLVGAEQQNEVVRFTVSDTGPGIPDDAIDNIFEPFRQARGSDGSRGTGLGLAITRRLVELMGSQIEIDTSPKGTTFSCSISFGRARRASDLARVARPATTTAGRVLVVDDGKVNRLVFQSQLERLGYEATLAVSGVQALEILEMTDDSFDAVLMDWHMPELDGLATAATIRRQEQAGNNGSGDQPTPRLPIIAVTASTLSGDRERCLAAGMDDFLAKPVALEDLDSALKRWVRSDPADGSSSDGANLGDPTAPALDPIPIDEIVAEVGDPGTVKILIETFQTELVAWRQALTPEAAANDPESAHRAAHTMKSALALLHVPDAADRCQHVEDLFAGDAPADEIQTAVRDLLGLMDRLTSVFDAAAQRLEEEDDGR